MKKIIFCFTALSFVIFMQSCNKKDKTQSKTELLTSGSWSLTASVTDNDANGSYEIDEYASFLACFKDNIFTFNSNGQLVLDEGVTKCNPADPQTETTTWSFASNETQMIVDSDTYSIQELTNSTLKIKQDLGGGRSNLVTFTKR